MKLKHLKRIITIVPFIFLFSFTREVLSNDSFLNFLNKVAEGKLVAQKCPKCSAVYVPPRGSCPRCGVATEEELELPDTGAVESFTIVHIPIPGNPIVPPYVSAMIRLDGADISFLHLIQEIDLADIRIGMRVQAVWKDKSDWGTTLENIKWFKPTGEDDVDPSVFKFKE